MIEKALFFGFFVAFLSCLYLGFSNGRFDLGKTLAVNFGGTIVFGLILAFIFYMGLPSFVGIWGGWYGVIAVPVLIASLVICFVDNSDGKTLILQVLKVFAILIGFLVIAFTPVMHWNDLYNIPQVMEIDNVSQAANIIGFTDPNHPRVVDIDLAYSKAHTIISDKKHNYGSIYEIRKSELHMQRIKGHEFWVVPMEFQDSYGKWDDKKISPGFVMVDAEDPFADARLVTGYNLKYLPSAYWGAWLPRYVYGLGYTDVNIETPIFEVTDNLDPYWVIPLTVPTVNNDGEVVRSVLTVQAETGNYKEYSLDQVPAWVDRVTPERLANKYATWKGAYVHGWWNVHGPSLFVSGADISELTTTTTRGGDQQVMYFITATDGRSYWFGGMTSNADSDQSLTSIVLVDSRDPTRVIRIGATGANEQAAMDALNAKFSQNPNWYGTAVIPYIVYGELTYVIPYDAHTSTGNNFEGVGFVHAGKRAVATGPTKEKAAENYKALLAEMKIQEAISSESLMKTIQGIVIRTGTAIASGQSVTMLWLNSSDIVFKVDSVLYPTASLTQVNDAVNISYIDTMDTAVGVEKFTNDMVKARIGKDQIRMDAELGNLTKQKEENWDVQEDLVRQLENKRKGE